MLLYLPARSGLPRLLRLYMCLQGDQLFINICNVLLYYESELLQRAT